MVMQIIMQVIFGDYHADYYDGHFRTLCRTLTLKQFFYSEIKQVMHIMKFIQGMQVMKLMKVMNFLKAMEQNICFSRSSCIANKNSIFITSAILKIIMEIIGQMNLQVISIMHLIMQVNMMVVLQAIILLVIFIRQSSIPIILLFHIGEKIS